MTYLPEQIQVRDFLRERGTNAENSVLLAESAAAFEKFHAQFAAVGPSVRLVEPFPGRWSPQQILDHVVECHRCAPEQLRRLLRGEAGNEPIRAYVQSPAPYVHAWRALLKEFRVIHNEIIDAAQSLALVPMPAVGAPIELVARLPHGRRRKEVEWQEYLDWKAYLQALRSHALQHVKQLERTLEEIA